MTQKNDYNNTVNIIDYLEENSIKWYPININIIDKSLSQNIMKKELVPYFKCKNYEYICKTNDFNKLVEKELKRRQKCIKYTNWIAIDSL
jgi:hypothetical protein